MTANPVEQQKISTVEDLIAMPDDGKRYELINGEIVEVGTANRKHTILGTWLLGTLFVYLSTNKIGGQMGGPDGTYRLDAANTRVPDISYLMPASAARIPAGSVYCPFAPDLAVEIKSPSNTPGEMRKLARLYIRSGSKLVWTISYEDKIAHVYRPGQLAVELDEDDELDGDDVLPGFTVKLADLFAQIEGV